MEGQGGNITREGWDDFLESWLPVDTIREIIEKIDVYNSTTSQGLIDNINQLIENQEDNCKTTENFLEIFNLSKLRTPKI